MYNLLQTDDLLMGQRNLPKNPAGLGEEEEAGYWADYLNPSHAEADTGNNCCQAYEHDAHSSRQGVQGRERAHNQLKQHLEFCCCVSSGV